MESVLKNKNRFLYIILFYLILSYYFHYVVPTPYYFLPYFFYRYYLYIVHYKMVTLRRIRCF